MFKVGDKIRAKSNYYGVTCKELNWEGVVTHSNKGLIAARTTKCTDTYYIDRPFHDLDSNEFELIEGKKDELLTFQEVIANIEPGQTYVRCGNYGTKEIHMRTNGQIVIEVSNQLKVIPTYQKYRLKEEKKIVYGVEHRIDGKVYDFLSDNSLEVGDFVVCNTKYGQSYGKVVTKELKTIPSKELALYKKCKSF